MLDTAGQQALALNHDRLARPIDTFHPGVPRPLERIPQPRDGKASFLIFLLTLDHLNHRVDNMPDLAIDVVGEDAAAHPYLVGCQALRVPARKRSLPDRSPD